MVPTVDGKAHDFRVAGLFHGLALMEDLQTRSSWDHTTGECIAGPLRGTQLPDVRPLRYVTPQAALRMRPDAEIALSRPGLRQRVLNRVFLDRMLRDEGHLPFLFKPSMAEGDTRRPAMELGLGVWWPGASRFYPMASIKAHGGALIDVIGDRRVLVYLDQGAHAPMAVRTEAETCRWEGEALVLSDGSVVQDLHVADASGLRRPVDMLPQLFTRWYGFSATFPGCGIHGD